MSSSGGWLFVLVGNLTACGSAPSGAAGDDVANDGSDELAATAGATHQAETDQEGDPQEAADAGAEATPAEGPPPADSDMPSGAIPDLPSMEDPGLVPLGPIANLPPEGTCDASYLDRAQCLVELPLSVQLAEKLRGPGMVADFEDQPLLNTLVVDPAVPDQQISAYFRFIDDAWQGPYENRAQTLNRYVGEQVRWLGVTADDDAPDGCQRYHPEQVAIDLEGRRAVSTPCGTLIWFGPEGFLTTLGAPAGDVLGNVGPTDAHEVLVGPGNCAALNWAVEVEDNVFDLHAAFVTETETYADHLQLAARLLSDPTTLSLGDGRFLYVWQPVNETEVGEVYARVYEVGEGWSEQHDFGLERFERPTYSYRYEVESLSPGEASIHFERQGECFSAELLLDGSFAPTTAEECAPDVVAAEPQEEAQQRPRAWLESAGDSDQVMAELVEGRRVVLAEAERGLIGGVAASVLPDESMVVAWGVADYPQMMNVTDLEANTYTEFFAPWRLRSVRIEPDASVIELPLPVSPAPSGSHTEVLPTIAEGEGGP